VWAVLAALGRDGVSGLVAGHVALARRFASGLAAGGLEVLNDVRLNRSWSRVRMTGDEEMITAVQRGGHCWCGPTTWRGRRAMRISVSTGRPAQADVDAASPPCWPRSELGAGRDGGTDRGCDSVRSG